MMTQQDNCERPAIEAEELALLTRRERVRRQWDWLVECAKGRCVGLWEWLETEKYRETVTLVWAVGTFCLGVVMMLDPESFYRPSFAVAVGWMIPEAWGLLFVMGSGATLLTLLAGRKDAYWPATSVTIMFSSWSAALLAAANDPGAVSSGAIIYTSLSVFWAFTALSYWRDSRRTMVR